MITKGLKSGDQVAMHDSEDVERGPSDQTIRGGARFGGAVIGIRDSKFEM